MPPFGGLRGNYVRRTLFILYTYIRFIRKNADTIKRRKIYTTQYHIIVPSLVTLALNFAFTQRLILDHGSLKSAWSISVIIEHFSLTLRHYYRADIDRNRSVRNSE